jgi:rhodanese-related sulfurtransferase
MDTAIPSVSVQDLARRLGTPRWPVVIDVRREARYADDPTILPAAARKLPDRVAEWAATLAAGAEVVCYCVYGHEVSQGVARALRGLGYPAAYLEGGIEGWRSAGAPVARKSARLGIPGAGPSRWITRERPKIDRIACPWLVRRFIDRGAQFHYAPSARVLDLARRERAVAFDIPGGAISHHGDLCSFDALLREFGLADPALHALALIVRGADTARLDLAPESAGLLAVSLGLSRLYGNDYEMLEHGVAVYDALYAWCREAHGEGHDRKPEPAR